MSSEAARLRLKTWILVPVVVLANAFGDFFMKRGMPGSLHTPFEYIGALFQPWVALGVVLLIVWQLSRMALLSWADLDRKSTRLNSSHLGISYAVFCLKKQKLAAVPPPADIRPPSSVLPWDRAAVR